MDNLPIFYAGLFGLLMLVSHLAGAFMANWSFRYAVRFQESLLAEQERLRQETAGQREQIFSLRQEILELRTQLAAALEQIARLSSLTTDEEGVIS